jgi:hypothetical protein
MKLHRKKPPKHPARQTRPTKGLPTAARLRLNVQQARARSGRRQ